MQQLAMRPRAPVAGLAPLPLLLGQEFSSTLSLDSGLKSIEMAWHSL